jgi:HK97 family phage portal protein
MLSIAQIRQSVQPFSAPKAELSGLKDPKIWMTNGWGAQNLTGVPVSEEISLQLTTVFRATQILSFHTATAPLHLFKSEPTGKKQITNHAAYDFVRAPGVDTSAFQMRQLAHMQVLLWGNSYWKITRDSNFRPVGVENLHPSGVQVQRVNGQRQYRYRGQIIPWYEVLHFMGSSIDGIKGLSVIQRMGNSVGISLATEQYQARFFSNGAHVDSILTLPEGHHLGDTETDEEVNGVLNSFKDKYVGMKNAHTPMVLEPGMKFERLDMPIADMQLIEQKKYSTADFARMFGVPLHKLAELERSTNNNIEHQSIEYVQDTIAPWCAIFEEEYRRKLLLESEQNDYYFKHNLNFLLRGDSKARAEYFSMALGSKSPAWMTQDQVRALEDMNPMGADVLYRPLNMTDKPVEETVAA